MSLGAVGCGSMSDFATQPTDGDTAAGVALDEIVPPSFQDSTGGQNAPSGNPGAECSGGVCSVESPEHSPVDETI